jgi:hypothetical protein
MRRSLRIFAKFIAGLAGTLIVLSLLLVWRLNAGPIRTEFFTPYIVNGIDKTIPGARTEITNAVLTWDNADRSVTLHADGIKISNANGDTIALLPSVGVRLSVIGVVLGQFLPTELVVDHLQVWIDRKPDGAFYFGGVTSTGESATDFRSVLKHTADNLAHALITRRLYISRLVVNVHDETTKNDWAVSVPEIDLQRTGINLAGQADIEVTQKDKMSPVTVRYEYDRLRGLHNLAARFSDITPAFFAGGKPGTLGLGVASILDLPLTGEINAAVDDDLNIEAIAAELHGKAGILDYHDFWDKPRAVKSIDIMAEYNRRARKLIISPLAVDFGGPKLEMTVTGSEPSDNKHDLDIVLTTKIDDWPTDNYAALWPKPIITDARDWIVTNISKGNFDHGEATFKGSLAWNDIGDVDLTEGNGKLAASGATVHYMDGMPPVENVGATATFDLKQMTVNITGGGIDELKIVPFALTIDGLDQHMQTATIPLRIAGPLPNILKLIDAPPLEYAKAIGLTPDDISGRAEGTVTFKFPLLKTLAMKDADIVAKAKLIDLESTKLLKGVDISQGALALDLDKSGFTTKGTVALNKVPLQIVWQQNFSTDNGKPLSTAEVTGSVQGEQWPLLGINAFAGTKGPTAVTIAYTQADKANATLTGTLDMANAETHLDQLDWKKSAGTAATLKFAAAIPAEGNIKVSLIDFEGPQLDIKGKAEMRSDATGFTSLDLKPMIIGRTNVALHFTQLEGKDGALHFDASGAALDVSGLRGGKDPGRTDPRPKEYRLKVDKLYTSDTGFISDAEGYAVRDEMGWSEVSFHGQAQGSHQLDIDLTAEDDGTRNFSATCDDFGKALQGLGFTDTVRDGALRIVGTSTADAPRTVEGTIKVGHFVVRDLPVLAFLLNATAPFNIGALVTNSAEFDHMKGRFKWEGDMIQLKGVNASGSAIGINIQGKVDMNTGAAKLNGTIVPFSMVNRIISYIPIIGDLITGGSGGGVLAVAYTVGGTLGSPKINVNPVSLLTPGFVRNLFFGGNDDEFPGEPEPGSTPAKTQASPAETNINKGR